MINDLRKKDSTQHFGWIMPKSLHYHGKYCFRAKKSHQFSRDFVTQLSAQLQVTTTDVIKTKTLVDHYDSGEIQVHQRQV